MDSARQPPPEEAPLERCPSSIKEIFVEFSEKANAEYLSLQKLVFEERSQGKDNSFNIQLLKAIDREKSNLKLNPQLGDHIPRRNIPKEAASRWGTDRLWRLGLVGYWRMIYTIIGDKVRIVAFVLEFMDHKRYDKVFGYRKK